MTEIALDRQLSLPIRQLASVLLKSFTNVHWSKTSDKFQEPEVNAENKQRVKHALLHALVQDCDLSENSAEKRLKSSVA